MVFRRLPEFLLLAVLTTPTAFAQAGLEVYCCEVNGQTACGDILPPVCYGRAYRVITPHGQVKRMVDAPPSREEILRAREAERKQKEEEEKLARRQRLDQALLDTYSNVTEIDAHRDRQLAEVERALEVLNARETELVDYRREIEKQIATFEEGKVPANIANQLTNANVDLQRNRLLIDAKMIDKQAILDRFETERRRYIELGGPLTKKP